MKLVRDLRNFLSKFYNERKTMQQVHPRGFQGKEPKYDPDLYPVVEVTFTVQGSVERIWSAWSEPKLFQQWWGPEGFACPEVTIDFQEGGRFTAAMKSPKGKIVWSSGEYKELVENKKIFCTDFFSDEKGREVKPSVYGMKGTWPVHLFITVELEALSDSETKINLKHEGIPAMQHDDCVAGWTSSFEKLQRLVQVH
jgi:uncharacterized protein YndB with AHSA1/START domain